MTTLHSKRLILRPLKLEDAGRVAELAGDWDIASMTARIPYPYDVSLAEDWIKTHPLTDFVRGIEFKGELIGATGFFPNDNGDTEIGYWIGRPWWGQGFATEATRALIHYCFTNAGLSRLACCHFIDNPASRRVIQKLGFKSTGPCKCYCDARQCDVPTERYVLKRPALAVFWRLQKSI
jgi:[ribosomal protein S5]-alanine N-acetyltransferase